MDGVRALCACVCVRRCFYSNNNTKAVHGMLDKPPTRLPVLVADAPPSIKPEGGRWKQTIRRAAGQQTMAEVHRLTHTRDT